MDSVEDSLVVPSKRSRAVPVIATVALVGVAVGAWWMFGRGKGQPENPARVLIVGPTPQLAGYLEDKGFAADYLSYGAAVGEGQTFDSSLQDLPAIVEYADQLGFGYVALSMANDERYDLASIDYPTEDPPPGTTFMVLSIGDLGTHVSYGGVPEGVLHEHPLDQQIGLLLALLDQPELAKAREGKASNDIMIRFRSAGTVTAVEELELAQAKMRRQAEAWHELAKQERGADKPIELARPFELVRGWPLANGSILLASARGSWRSSNGLSATWSDTSSVVAELSVVKPDALDQRSPCPALPDRLPLDGGFALAERGDALLIPSNAYVAELWTLDQAGCGFERRDEIRRLGASALGLPHASGRTATVHAGQLEWADAKMRAYRHVRFGGVELHPDALRWISDDVVVIPASLDFALAAEDQHQRASKAALAAGLPAPAAPASTGPEPEPTDALVFVRLPAHDVSEQIDLAVVPADALVGDDAGPVNVRAAFAIAGESPSVIAYVDSNAGLQLIRTSVPASGPAWQNGLASEYQLASAVAAGRAAASGELLARDIPLDAHELVVSPTGSHAAWAAPVGSNMEIFVLSLTSASASPVRMTDNARDDSSPFFAGQLLFFSSDYRVDDSPLFEGLRALPIR